MHLKGKKILLAVSGSIAAYKTPELVRLLLKSGAEVQVVMTAAAADFVSPLSLSTVSKQAVYSNVHDGAAWNNHVALGRWADCMLIAPCSANTLAKLANGLCDNLLCAVYLSASCPVFFAPAMDEDMWLHPATKANVASLISYGNHLIPVGHGELASGLIGEGRMAEPDELRDHLAQYFASEERQELKGQKALVTAGPTYERLDPVRFIGNFSTGKMGIALAEALADRGADVTLVLGPTNLRPHHKRITTVPVGSAAQMLEESEKVFDTCEIAILAAAVADYRPTTIADDKIKKQSETLEIHLSPTEDILKTLAKKKKPNQVVIGFALETTDEQSNAGKKLRSKGADMIILNSLRDAGAGFGYDTNKVSILRSDGETRHLPLQSKTATAIAIVHAIIEYRNEPKEL